LVVEEGIDRLPVFGDVFPLDPPLPPSTFSHIQESFPLRLIFSVKIVAKVDGASHERVRTFPAGGLFPPSVPRRTSFPFQGRCGFFFLKSRITPGALISSPLSSF